MSDTPRTDANLVKNLTRTSFAVVDPMFARQLERELTEARTRIKELADIGGALFDNIACGCSDGGCKTCRRAIKDWNETVKRCLEGIQ